MLGASILTITTLSLISLPIDITYLRSGKYCSDSANLSAAYEEEEHGEENEDEVYDFGLEVLLMEGDGSKEEADDNAASAHHGDDGYHRAVE